MVMAYDKRRVYGCDGGQGKEKNTCQKQKEPRKKEELEATKKKHQEDKLLQEARKKERVGQIIAKLRIDEAWSIKNCTTIGDGLHKKFKENPSIMGYKKINVATCHQCASTMSIAIEKRKGVN